MRANSIEMHPKRDEIRAMLMEILRHRQEVPTQRDIAEKYAIPEYTISRYMQQLEDGRK